MTLEGGPEGLRGLARDRQCKSTAIFARE
jgi:hypothetical protein